MRKIDCWDDLTKFGIEILTGEACGLGYRYLCDVTERGRTILAKAFGIPSFTLADPWNRGLETDPAVGSIMLTQSMLVPIGIFALLESGCREVWLYQNGSLLGIDPSDCADQVQVWEKMAAGALMRRFRYAGTAGDRNIHQFTGRVE
jgi:hypothetical protein